MCQRPAASRLVECAPIMMYHLASGNARYSACSPGTPLYLQAASALLTARVMHDKVITKAAGAGHVAQPMHDGLRWEDRAVLPSPVHGLSSAIGAHPCQAPPLKPFAAS